MDRTTRPSRPNVDLVTVSEASGAVMGVRRACSALDMAAVEASTRDVTTPDVAMITTVVGVGERDAQMQENHRMKSSSDLL